MGIFDTETSTTNNNPIADLQADYLPGIYGAANDLYNQGSPGFYPGSTVAALDPVRAQGLNLGVDAALGSQTSLANNQTGLLNNILSGNDPYTNQLAQQAAAGVASSFGQAGSLGSARNYQQGNLAASNAILGRQLDASQQVAQAQQNAYAPSQTLQDIGTVTQQQNQNIINADKQRYDYQATQPWDHLERYQNVITNPNAAAYNEGSTTTKDPSILDIATGIGTVVAGLGNQGGLLTKHGFGGNGRAQGGMAPRRHMNYGMLAEGGDVPTLQTQQVSPGAYAPVATQSTQYAGSDWTRPTPGHGWAIIDGRYQLVPSTQGIQPGGGNLVGYTPPQIAAPTSPVATAPTTGSNNTTPITGPSTTQDANGNPAPYLGVDPYDKEGDDNFLTAAETASRVKIISDVIGADYDPNTTILTPAQRAAVENNLDARLAMDDIYMNNQVIYGSQTGNNKTSLTTGSLTDTGFIADAAKAVTSLSPLLKALLPEGFSKETFGDNTQVQFDAQTAHYAKEAGAIENPDGTYDISAWFNPTAGESSNIHKDAQGNLYDKDGTLLGTVIDGVVSVVSGVGEAVRKSIDKFLGTEHLENKHPTDVIHTQVKEDPKTAGNNIDKNGNPRPPIPQEVLNGDGNVYYNSVTGAWTNKETGIPLGGEIVSDYNSNTAQNTTPAEKAAADKLRAEEEAKYKESEEKAERERLAAIERARLAEEIRLAEEKRQRDKQSAGSQALADSTRAQLDFTSKNKATTPGAASDYGDLNAQGGYIQKHNQGGRVSKLPAWMNFRNTYGV